MFQLLANVFMPTCLLIYYPLTEESGWKFKKTTTNIIVITMTSYLYVEWTRYLSTVSSSRPPRQGRLPPIHYPLTPGMSSPRVDGNIPHLLDRLFSFVLIIISHYLPVLCPWLFMPPGHCLSYRTLCTKTRLWN